MSTKEEYRRYARECVELLRAVTDEKTRAALSHMAQVWLRLADQKDDPIDEPQGEGNDCSLGQFRDHIVRPDGEK